MSLVWLTISSGKKLKECAWICWKSPISEYKSWRPVNLKSRSKRLLYPYASRTHRNPHAIKETLQLVFFFFLGRRMKFIEANRTYNIKLIQKKSSSISKHSLANKRTHSLKILEIKLNSTDLKTLDDPIFFALNSFYDTQHIQPHFN